MKALKKYRWPLTGALVGVLIFLAVYGVRVLDPTSVDWILNNPSPDPAQHYLGWELFRRSPVHLPYLGANYSAVYPFRTSVLFTDSLPLAALFFKLLGGVLPTRFQYFGWWGLLCYALQGGLAQAVIARIAGLKTDQKAKLWGSVAGAGVLVLFPALTMRTFAHEALAATWLVLLALYLWMRSDELIPTTRRACLLWGGMGLLCAGIHLYYLPMVGLVLVGYAVRRTLQKRGPAAVLAPIAAFCAAALAELVLLGAFAVNFAGYSNGYLSGADYLGLFVPWYAPGWEQNVYMGVGAVCAVVLAIFSMVCNARKAEKFFAAHRDWVAAGLVVLVLDLVAAGGNAITVGGKTLFTVPIPQFLMDFWAMFSSCARLAWLAGMLLAVTACGLVLRFWEKGAVPALMLAVCAVAQGWGQRGELFNRWTDYHYYDFRYENKSLLTDPAWEDIAASGKYSHLAFATFDFEHDEFWDLVDFAADHSWTSNSFYMAHMDGNLAAVTLPGELNELSADTLYAFIDEDELARNSCDLHYYRLDGILIGSVEPIDGLEEEPAPEVPSRTMDLTKSDVDPLFLAADGIVLGMNGEMMTEEWTLFPGRYRVTLTGSGFDHSYIYARYGLINQEIYKLDIDFTGIDPNEMTFEFTATEMLHYWRTAVHTLDDTNVTVNSVTVEKIG
ncbi:DUF6311 domain-containing protein [uncultured Gemmiger sp.]|uniref:DUF6311 domain-containing protein n=1 Tax=uncultured Gemmiger sp. TaxID=1623490 RepID=UPI00259AA5A6|nr:DUF6311 domain-containing protein [uncultured Gemmiger sp.]